MKKLLWISAALSLALLILWQLFAENTNYYIVCAAVLILSMFPFLISFEKEDLSAKEVTLVASLIALAVVSRAVFYLIPQIKPIGAVVGVSAACLGAKRGYLIGAFSMFISNFIFGQGIWTPFQMVAMGFVGLIFGAVFRRIKSNRYTLALVGFLSVTVVYGVIADLPTVLMLSGDIHWQSVLSVYAAAIPFNLVFGVTTAVFLFLFGEAFVKKIERINTKYGICKSEVQL